MPWSLHFMQNWFIVLWSNFKSWLRLPCVNIDYTLWIQLERQIYNAKINDFTCWRYILGYVLWGGELLGHLNMKLGRLSTKKISNRGSGGIYVASEIAIFCEVPLLLQKAPINYLHSWFENSHQTKLLNLIKWFYLK